MDPFHVRGQRHPLGAAVAGERQQLSARRGQPQAGAVGVQQVHRFRPAQIGDHLEPVADHLGAPQACAGGRDAAIGLFGQADDLAQVGAAEEDTVAVHGQVAQGRDPDPAAAVDQHAGDPAGRQRRRVAGIEGFESAAVEARQAVLGRQPEQALVVAGDRLDGDLRQPGFAAPGLPRPAMQRRLRIAGRRASRKRRQRQQRDNEP